VNVRRNEKKILYNLENMSGEYEKGSVWHKKKELLGE
jgi:hypothetical protein